LQVEYNTEVISEILVEKQQLKSPVASLLWRWTRM